MMIQLSIIPFLCLGAIDNLENHKNSCLQEIRLDPAKGGREDYPLARVIRTVSATDADEIPKIEGAGELFHEEGINYQLMHNGIKVLQDGYYDSWMTDIISALKGHHEPQEEKVFYEVLKYIEPGSTMIELGSYWGYYSLWFQHSIPQANNWLIEPIEKNIEIGKSNFSLNRFEGHFILGYIRSRKKDTAAFPGASPIEIDSFIKENRISRIHLLHSDIQGAEYAMLQGAEQSMNERKIDYFFISTHTDKIHAQCKRALRKFNYQIIAEHTMRESCSYDGLIVAKREELAGPTSIAIRKYPESFEE